LLLAILSDEVTYDLETRIRIAAAICNLAQTQNSQRSFASCFAVHVLSNFVIGKHQALTGASALILKSMLKSEFLISSMNENGVPLALIRAVLLCNDAEISDIVVDLLIRMTMIDSLKEFMLEHRTVQICAYLLHVLACRHYHLVTRNRTETPDHSQPSFISQSTRNILILYLSPAKDKKSEKCDDWEDRMRKETFLGWSEDEGDFSQVQVIHVSLLLEFLSWILLSSSDACNQFIALPFALDVLQYWMHNGSPLMKQSALSSTSVLLRNGHRAFVTLRDIINILLGILLDGKRHSGVNRIQYKITAIETLNELCIFGGDNMCLAMSAAGVLKPMLELLEVEDYQLQHFTLRTMNSICSHFHPLGTLVSIDGIPCLCEFLERGLKEILGPKETEKRGPFGRAGIRGRLRKRVETPEAEADLKRGHGDDYSRVRRLDYCSALLRSITACQSTDWVSFLNQHRIIPLALDALSQNYSTAIKKQALGILASLVLMKDSNVVTDIASESGCGLLLELLIQTQRSQELNKLDIQRIISVECLNQIEGI